MKKIFALLLFSVLTVFSGILLEENFNILGEENVVSRGVLHTPVAQKLENTKNPENSAFSWLTGNTSSYKYLEKDDKSSVTEKISLEKVNQVYSLLKKYDNDFPNLSNEKLEEGLIRGLIFSLDDPHTNFFNEKQGDDFEKDMAGDFEGIGAVLEKQNKNLVITEVLKGRPAAQAGLLPGDIILKVDDKSVEDETIWETILRIRGEKGTKVALEIFRPGKNESENFLTITPTRDTIHVESVEFSWKGKNSDIAVLEISQFGDEMITELEKNLKKIQEKKEKGEKISGIIIDLRYNGGGYLTGAVDLASYFLETHTKIVSIESRNVENNQEYFTKKSLLRYDFLDTKTPLLVLVNGGSASASEIFAGAIQESKRGKLLGTKTYGKGSVQQIFPLEENPNEFVKITIAKWLLPSGRNITHEEPLTPDIEVEWKRNEMTDEQRAKKYDPQMEKALEELAK